MLRFEGTEIVRNVDMKPAHILQYCELDETNQTLMRTAMRQLHLSARAYHRALKLTRIIADLAKSDSITQIHLAEVLQYRPKEFDP